MGRKTRRWLFALGLLGSLSAHAGSPVWAIHGDHNTVYLAGSVHLLKAGDAALPPAFNRAYSSSKSLVMELALDKVDPMEAAGWMMEHGTLKEGTDLREVIGDERYKRMSAEAERLNVPTEVLDRLEPWVVALQLLELKYVQLGFDPQQGVEQQLEHRAQADGKPIEGLETLDEQLGVLQGMSYSDQARFLDMVIGEMQDVGSETDSVVDAWRRGDSAKLGTLLSDEYKSFPALYRALVTDRNRHWLPQIEKMLHADSDYLVVVGALHLVGQGGLLELVQHDGYKPEAVN
ncbi:MAG TPA: TraB/GumN family protein [Steroidobacteraceae bacterium]|nr:TraB/GumN family protein [Steroidobacteraceae bacterium]